MQVVEINEQTRLPLGLVAGAFATFAGLIFWLTVLYTDVAQAKKDISTLHDELQALQRIEVRISNMEGRLDVLAQHKPK